MLEKHRFYKSEAVVNCSFALLPALLIAIPAIQMLMIGWDSKLLMPHDGIIAQHAERIVFDQTRFTLNAMASAEVMPFDALKNVGFSLFGRGGAEIVPRFFVLVAGTFLLTLFCLWAFSSTLIDKTIVCFAVASIFLQPSFQWGLNAGVLLNPMEQLLYISVCFILALFLCRRVIKHSHFVMLSVTLYTVGFIAALFTFAKILVFLVFATVFLPILILRLLALKQNLIVVTLLIPMIITCLLLGLSFLEIYNLNGKPMFDLTYLKDIQYDKGRSDGNIGGGIFYQLLGLNNWTMYVTWLDRAFGNLDLDFSEFKTILVCSIPLVLFTFCFKEVLRNPSVFLPALLLVCLCSFVAKGPQSPFGSFFLFLVEKYPLFTSLRTPDNKIGIMIIPILLITLCSCLSEFKIKRIVLSASLLGVYIGFFAVPYITMKTIQGGFDQQSGNLRYVVDVSAELELINALSKKVDDMNIIVFPGYGRVRTSSGMSGWKEPLTTFVPAFSPFITNQNLDHNHVLTNWLGSFDHRTTQDLGYKYLVFRKSWLESAKQSICLECLNRSDNYQVVFDDENLLAFEFLQPGERFSYHFLTQFSSSRLQLKAILTKLKFLLWGLLVNLLLFFATIFWLGRCTNKRLLDR